LVEDKLDHRPKGFGYVEFGSVDGLKKALTLSESQFQGRNIRISIAEPREFIPIYARGFHLTISQQRRDQKHVRLAIGAAKDHFQTCPARAAA